MNIAEFVLKALQKEYTIDKSVNLNTFNYVENGYVDSLGIIQFVSEIEDKFGITFSDEELASPSFQIVGELIKFIDRKMKEDKS